MENHGLSIGSVDRPLFVSESGSGVPPLKQQGPSFEKSEGGLFFAARKLRRRADPLSATERMLLAPAGAPLRAALRAGDVGPLHSLDAAWHIDR